KTLPRRTDALEEVLRLAAAHAYRRQAAVSVADIVRALLDSGAEFTSLQRLLAPTTRFHRTESPFDSDIIRERVRTAAAPFPPERPRERDVERDAPDRDRHGTRIDVLEQSIRDLTEELANERKIISGVLQDLQRELMAQREDTGRLGGNNQDKIQA